MTVSAAAGPPESVDVRATDVLVVGGGSAGSVLAGRLSEDPATRVGLVEAGGGLVGRLDDVAHGAAGDDGPARHTAPHTRHSPRALRRRAPRRHRRRHRRRHDRPPPRRLSAGRRTW